jgi:hypothetical protein
MLKEAVEYINASQILPHVLANFCHFQGVVCALYATQAMLLVRAKFIVQI